MSTRQFVEPSPYAKPPTRASYEEDYKHLQYLEAAGINSSCSSEKPGRINAAIFGVGRAGTFHLLNILASPKVKLIYVVETCSDRLKYIKEKYDFGQEVSLTSDPNVAWSDTNLNAVIITTPTGSHEDLVTKSLLAGKAVFCEKPISTDVDGIERCYALAHERGLPLLCAFNRRFDPAFSKIGQEVHAGKIGQLQTIKSTSRDNPLPSLEFLRSSGGVFHDMFTHDVDLACWIAGEYPDKVFAMGHAFAPEIGEIPDYDTVATTMQFPSGTIGMIDFGRNAVYGYDQRLEVFGHKGMLSAANQKPSEVSLSTSEGDSSQPILHSFPSRYEVSYRRELDHFCDVVLGRAELSITGESVMNASRIVSALCESAKTGKVIHMTY